MNKPNYQLRRIIAATILVLTFWSGANVIKAVMSPDYSCMEISHVVVPGDSLWSIADQYCSGSISHAVYDLSSNYGKAVYPNQVITIEER